MLDTIKEKWPEILDFLKLEFDITDVSFKTWILPLKVESYENNVLTLIFPGETKNTGLNYIQKKYYHFIKIAIEENIDNINSHECYYDYIQLNSLITLAKAMILSANERRESRGSHQRIDYPETNDEKYLKNTTVILEKNNIKISFEETNNKMGW